MYARTRLATLTAAALFSASLLAAGGVATANAVVPTCFGRPVTIVVPAPGMVTNGTAVSDVILGTAGNDTINGLGDDDYICAGAGNDNITGGEGDDHAAGGPGDDDFLGGPDDDYFDGGPHLEGDRGNGNAGVNFCVRTEVVVNC